MKHWYIPLLFLLPIIGLGQNARIDSLRRELTHARQDTSRVKLLADLADAYTIYQTDSSVFFGQKALSLSRVIGDKSGECKALQVLGNVFREQARLSEALDYAYKLLKIAREIGDKQQEGLGLNSIGVVYSNLQDNRQAISYYQQAIKLFYEVGDTRRIGLLLNNMTSQYMGLDLLDSARILNQQAYQYIRKYPEQESILEASIIRNTGRLYELAGGYSEALVYYRKALQLTYRDNNLRTRSQLQYFIANLFKQLHKPDSSLHYAKLALQNSRFVYKTNILRTVQLITNIYTEQHQLDSAFHYQQLVISASDSIYGAKNFQNLQRLVLDEQTRQQALQEEQKEKQNRVRMYGLLAGLGVVLLIAFILYRNNRQKHRANAVLQKTLSDLRTTQTQLIQREKMASLGELTAGIAHEIQNPLNFVNNFSDVSVELVEELKDELAKGDTAEAGLLADDLSQNLQRITQNGQRASNIVRSMLEHSRSSTGERLPTDLNALADEYLHLAFQGMRAKHKDFNCKLEMTFDPNLPPVSVVAQDLSRVLLNLFNNAFYAVGQKKKTASVDYQPTVSVSTALVHGGAEIRVRDNGGGIPEAIREKIFQPFFTTKPTGEGTGLGLSLSYDIVTKGHGGTLTVESQEGAFTEFVITLNT